MKNSLLVLAEKYRTSLTRILAVFFVSLLVLSGGGPASNLDSFFEMIGIFLLALCAFGRLWASVYISGNKMDNLVEVGPYSIVRHPLYLFSFLGVLGWGFISKSPTVFICLVLSYVAYYPLVMISEERTLVRKHGERYLSYMERVPRFFPNLSLLREPVMYNVHTVILRKSIFDAVWFIWGIIPVKIIEYLRVSGLLPFFP